MPGGPLESTLGFTVDSYHHSGLLKTRKNPQLKVTTKITKNTYWNLYAGGVTHKQPRGLFEVITISMKDLITQCKRPDGIDVGVVAVGLVVGVVVVVVWSPEKKVLA